ncbi:hypothetical protein [Pseudoxanthomonas winnipegensis]|uniref:Uncharacterized protein n=1 Tax=Pseudoxanthomonas winnipegensis TaxID=2480810 RepID=A0A4V2HGH2_9GAMM|nr:hypothetical protein [Pseudoxanthomonas winnipegensis]TAA46566.1 hypothetical protein EA655_02490 [Pseudoxanthomonas winnipegensis]
MRTTLLPTLLLALSACAPEAPQAGAPVASAPAASTASVASAPAAALSASAPAATQETSTNDAEVDARIDQVLGDHAAYRSVLERLQAAVKADDRPAVAALMRYPFEVRLADRKRRIDNAQDFVAQYEQILTPAIAQVITAQRYGALQVNQNGVMLGSGQVWINGVCNDAACKDVDVKVVALQQGG